MRTVHLPAKSIVTRRFAKGYSQTVHHESNNLTFWNDSKAVVLIDNEIPASEDNWDLIEIRSSGKIILVNGVNAQLVSRGNKKVHVIIFTERLSQDRTELLKMISNHIQLSMLVQFLSKPPISLTKRTKLI